MLTTVYSSTLLNITQPSESQQKECFMLAIPRSKVLKYRNKIYAKRTIILKLATAFRDYLHAFPVHSRKLSEVGTDEGIPTT